MASVAPAAYRRPQSLPHLIGSSKPRRSGRLDVVCVWRGAKAPVEEVERQLVQGRSEKEGVPDQAQVTHRLFPTAFLPAWLGFGLVSFDLFSPNSLHLLQAVDVQVHEFVQAQCSVQFRVFVADKIISNVPIGLGICAWAACTIEAIAAGRPREHMVLAASWLLYLLCVGCVIVDPVIVDTLKHAFQRDRPSVLLHNFSFPSGHTTAAVFIAGALLNVLLPLATSKGGYCRQLADKLSQSPKVITLAWTALGATTAAGRVLADVHWLSDTVAGACLATCLVCLLQEAALMSRRSE